MYNCTERAGKTSSDQTVQVVGKLLLLRFFVEYQNMNAQTDIQYRSLRSTFFFNKICTQSNGNVQEHACAHIKGTA